MAQNVLKHDKGIEFTDAKNPRSLVEGCTEDQYVVQPRDPKDVGMTDLAIKFQINDFEREFVDILMTDPYRNQTKALLKMRPDAKSASAKTEASRIMSDVNVRSYMQYCIEANHKALVATREMIQFNLKAVADRCMQVEPVLDAKGQPTGEYKFDASGANQALKLLGQTIGLFKEESRIKIQAGRPLLTITVPKHPKEEIE